MFQWLRGRTPVEAAIDREDYLGAIKLVREELNKYSNPNHVRPLRQQMAEIFVLNDQADAAVMILRELFNEYLKEGRDTKAIAIQKRIEELTGEDQVEQDLDKVAAAVIEGAETEPAEDIRPIDLSPDDEEGVPERVARKAARVELFGSMSKDEVRAFIKGLKLHSLQPGEIVMVEGEPGDSLFILTDGEVRVHVRNAAQKTVQIREMADGSFFGEISIVYGKPRTATITCATPCELLELDKAALDEIAKSHPGVSKVLKEFCDRRTQSPEEKEGRESK